MSNEIFKYECDNKELLLKVLTGEAPYILLNQTLALELHGFKTGQTTPDFLEVLSGQELLDSVKNLQLLIQNEDLNVANEGDKISDDPFVLEKRRSFFKFVGQLEKMVDDKEERQKVGKFIHVHRKNLGYPENVKSFKLLIDILDECFRKDLLSNDVLFLVNYPGSFDPFPHAGHIEAAKLFDSNYSNYYSQQPRVLITTSKNSTEGKNNEETFLNRLENMHRGFFEECYSSVLGIPGDVIDKTHRISQLTTLARFDSEKKLRFLFGSDNFIKKVKEAVEGDLYAQLLLNPANTLFLSIRPDVNKKSLKDSLGIAENTFRVKPIILPNQKITLSGSRIRSLPDSERAKLRPNQYITQI